MNDCLRSFEKVAGPLTEENSLYVGVFTIIRTWTREL